MTTCTPGIFSSLSTLFMLCCKASNISVVFSLAVLDNHQTTLTESFTRIRSILTHWAGEGNWRGCNGKFLTLVEIMPLIRCKAIPIDKDPCWLSRRKAPEITMDPSSLKVLTISSANGSNQSRYSTADTLP